MNAEQLIRESATRGPSRHVMMRTPGLNCWKSDLIAGAMGPTGWAESGTTLGNRPVYGVLRDRFTPAQAVALERARERWSESRRLIADGVTRTTAELMEHSQSPVHATTIRRRAAVGMSLRGAFIAPCRQPKPGRRDP